MGVNTKSFGKTKDGREVTMYSITNSRGARADIIDYGAILVNLFMPDDGKMLIREAQGQVAEMRQLVNDLRKEYAELKRKIEGLSDTLLAISEAQKEHGVITDEKARNVVALYAALLTMGEKAGADAEDAVRNAGYVVYAYLGGQARRDITYTQEFEK